MDSEDIQVMCGLCNNLEQMIKNNIYKVHTVRDQKILMDLFSSVLNFQLAYKRG